MGGWVDGKKINEMPWVQEYTPNGYPIMPKPVTYPKPAPIVIDTEDALAKFLAKIKALKELEAAINKEAEKEKAKQAKKVAKKKAKKRKPRKKKATLPTVHDDALYEREV